MISDAQIHSLLGKLAVMWRVNRDKTIADMLWEAKGLSDNPSRPLENADNHDIEQGIDRYITQERRDHPDRFAQANKESLEEHNKNIIVSATTEKPKYPGKDAAPEVLKEYRQANIAYARSQKKLSPSKDEDKT
jgi:hypothetical protein